MVTYNSDGQRKRWSWSLQMVSESLVDAPPRILIVDGDIAGRKAIAAYLAAQGLAVAQVGNAEEMGRALKQGVFDLIVLEVLLSGESGLSACARLSKEPNAPAIVFLSGAAQDSDRIIGLESGADDYLTKPCSHRELLARIRSVLRRQQLRPTTLRMKLANSGLWLDISHHHLEFPDGTTITLTQREFDLLSAFFSRPGRILSRSELIELVCGVGADGRGRTVDTQVSRLRRKIQSNIGRPIIWTCRGAGYMLAPPDAAACPTSAAAED